MYEKTIIHFSPIQYRQSILKHGLTKSIHRKGYCQWLGDGWYFFDENINKFYVQRMLKIKAFSNLLKIKKNISTPLNNHYNLNDSEDREFMLDLSEYLVNHNIYYTEHQHDLTCFALDYIQKSKQFNNSRYGYPLGNFINLAEEELVDTEEAIISVECSFTNKWQIVIKKARLINPIEMDDIIEM